MDDDIRVRREYWAKIVQAYGSLLVPVMLLILTLSFNGNANRVAAAESCRGKMIDLFDNVTKAETDLDGKSPTARDAVLRRFEMAYAMIEESCGAADLKIPSQLTIYKVKFRCSYDRSELTCPGPAYADSAGLTAPSETGESAPGVVVLPDPSNPSLSGLPGDAMAAPGDALTTFGDAMSGSDKGTASVMATANAQLYIQIGNENQRGGATRLQAQLNGAAWYGGKLAVPNGIDLALPVASNQLRCLKALDCKRAPLLVALIGQKLPGLSLQIVNLSGRYETDKSVKAGTFELWLAPGTNVGG